MIKKFLAVLFIFGVAVVSGCSPNEDIKAEEAGRSPADSKTAIAAQNPADTAGTIPVVWASKSGTARTDMLGMLSDTPLAQDSDMIKAQRTVEFTPNAPDAVSTSGKYVYTLELKKAAYPEGEVQTSGVDYYRGTLTIDWTMTIDRGPHSKNDFHAVYEGTAVAYVQSSTGKVSQGTAKGTASTTDTFISDGYSTPFTASDEFEWIYSSP